MKKVFKLEELECANCAAKMEDKINKLPEVIFASISFMASTLTIEAEEKDFENAVKKAQKVISKIESDCRIVL